MIVYSESPGWSLLFLKQRIISPSYHQMHPIMSLNTHCKKWALREVRVILPHVFWRRCICFLTFFRLRIHQPWRHFLVDYLWCSMSSYYPLMDILAKKMFWVCQTLVARLSIYWIKCVPWRPKCFLE